MIGVTHGPSSYHHGFTSRRRRLFGLTLSRTLSPVEDDDLSHTVCWGLTLAWASFRQPDTSHHHAAAIPHACMQL